MPIENPIISPIGGPVGSAEGAHVEGERLGAALTDLGGAVGQWRTDKVVDEFKNATDTEEAAFMEEQYNLIKERDKEADILSSHDAIQAATANPQAQQMLAAMTAADSAAEQGIIDNNRLGVRKEKIFREYAAKYPRLIPEFLKVASSSGLGGTSSLTTQEMTDYLNDGARQRQAELEATRSAQADYRKQIEKNARKLGLEPLPPNATIPQLGAWTEQYIKRAALHGAYTVDSESFSMWQNSVKVDEHAVQQRLNSLFATHGAAMVGELDGVVNEVTAAVYGVSDPTKLGEALSTGDVDKLNTALRARYARWKQDTMNRMGANTPGGQYITPTMWQQQFAASDAYMEQVYSTIGTKQTVDKMKMLRDAQIQIVENQLDPVNQALLGALSSIKGSSLRAGNAHRDISHAVTDEVIDIFQNKASTSMVAGSDDMPALIDKDGNATPWGANNSLRVAEALPDVKDQPTREKLAATHLEIVDEAIRSSDTREDADPTITSSVNNGLLSQVLSTMDYVGEKSRMAFRRGKTYAPEDSLMATGVRAMASPEFAELFNGLDKNTRASAQDSMSSVLQYEIAYLAQFANNAFAGYSQSARSGAASVDVTKGGFLAGLSGGVAPPLPKETLETSSYDGEIFQLNVDQSTGEVSFVVQAGALKALPPDQREAATRYARNFTLERGHRFTNALQAQVNLGLYADPVSALEAAAEAEGWPRQLALGVVGDTKGTKSKTKAEQDTALEKRQKEARGEVE